MPTNISKREATRILYFTIRDIDTFIQYDENHDRIKQMSEWVDNLRDALSYLCPDSLTLEELCESSQKSG